jgi:pyruvate, orthophosphate dikinase
VTISGLVHDVAAIDGQDVARFGGKAAGLSRMVGLRLPVPPAFVIETAACRMYQGTGDGLPEDLRQDLRSAVAVLESKSGKSFGGVDGVPLLVSVRSGAQVSMPGMMDTVLNLGLDVPGVLALAAACDDAPFVVDTWARFWTMYADIVLDVDPDLLGRAIEHQRARAADNLTEQTAIELQTAVVEHLVGEGCVATTDPWEQLDATIGAVFASWDSRRARTYRFHHGIPDDLGTAVTIQAMVFGNLGQVAGSGVAFTRDPSTGQAELYGEFLAGGQGEDVVAGTATPTKLREATGTWKVLVEELTGMGRTLELEYRDALDIEFTVEDGKLYLLQVRPAKRTADAAVTIALDLANFDIITRSEALHRVGADQVAAVVTPRFDTKALQDARAAGRLLASGIPASPGHAVGMATLDPDRAAQLAAEGQPAVLVRPTTSPQDLHGMIAAEAVVTQRGGATSHAAVVSRALDKACVVGCETIEVDLEQRRFTIGRVSYQEGTWLSVDGTSGEIYLDQLPRGLPEGEAATLNTLLAWADGASDSEVWLSAADPRGQSGAGVVGLVDVLVAAARLEEFVAAVDRFAKDPAAPVHEVEDVIVEVVRTACEELFPVSAAPLHLRMPSLYTARARRLLTHWTSLAPHQLRPLGAPRILESCVRAVGLAVEATDREDVTLLLAGVGSAPELTTFANLVHGHPRLEPGAVLQSAAAVFGLRGLTPARLPLWIDLPAVFRTVEGRVDDLLPAAAEEEAPPEDTLAASPLVELVLKHALEGADPNAFIGVDLSTPAGATLVGELHGLGLRRYAGAPVHAEKLRLRLGQHTTKEESHG